MPGDPADPGDSGDPGDPGDPGDATFDALGGPIGPAAAATAGGSAGGASGASPPDPSRRPAGAPPGRTGRRRRLLVWSVLVVAALAWLALAGVSLARARSEAAAGIDGLKQVRADLSPTDIMRGTRLPALRRSHAHFARAHDHVRSPFVAPLRILPVIGRQVRSIDALASSAERVVGAGVDAMTASQELLVRRPEPGPARVRMLRDLTAIARRARLDVGGIDLGPSQALLGPLARARDDFAEQLGALQRGLADAYYAGRGVSELVEGPSRYLVLAANNGEMRAGSGMLLSAGALTFREGRFHLGAMTSTTGLALPRGAVPVTGDLAALWGWTYPSQDWRNLAISPRFDTTGPLATAMWKARTGDEVDGVIVLDPVALRSLLAVTGPVTVDGREIGEGNVVQQVLLDQYREFNPTSPAQAERRERLSATARAAIQALDERGWGVSDLLDRLRTAARGRHVLAWSSHPGQQRAWVASGVAGRLTRGSLLVSVLNRNGTKLDQFLAVDATVTTQRAQDGTAVTLTLRLSNTTPEGLPGYVVGPYPGLGLAAREYGGILSVNVPGTARRVRFGAGGAATVAGRDGETAVIARDVRLTAGARAEVVIRFDLPEGVDSIRVEPSARIPGIVWHHGPETWNDGAPRDLRW